MNGSASWTRPRSRSALPRVRSATVHSGLSASAACSAQIEDGPAVGLGVGGASLQSFDFGQVATGDDVHDGYGPVAGDEVEGGTEGVPGPVELTGVHPAAAHDQEQTGASPRLIARHEMEGGLGGPQGFVGVTEGDQPARLEQGQLSFHERAVNAGGG